MNLIEAYANLDNESKKTQKRLDEKIPRDLANAMKRVNANNILTRRSGYSKVNLPDFENNQYTEITPEEAVALKKQGNADKVKALVQGDYVDFYSDGSTINKSDSVRNSFGTLVKNAEKIYRVDGNDSVAQEKRQQRAKNNSLDYYATDYWGNQKSKDSISGDTGEHVKVPTWVASKEKWLQRDKDSLSDLEKKWEDGDISRNEYNSEKQRLQDKIAYQEQDIADDKNNFRNKAYDNRYDAEAKRMQSRINRFKDIKDNPAEEKVRRRKTDVEKAEKEYQEKIAKREADIARLQKELDSLKADKNNDSNYRWANAELKKAEDKLAQQKKDLADIKSGKWSVDDMTNESLKERNKRSLRESQNKLDAIYDMLDNTELEYNFVEEYRNGWYIVDICRQDHEGIGEALDILESAGIDCREDDGAILIHPDAADKLPLDAIPDTNTVSSKLKTDVTGYPESLELLSIGEARKLPAPMREYGNVWWLRSPGELAKDAVSVFPDGLINVFGINVNFDMICVCPVLKISNLEASNLKLYDFYRINNIFDGIYIGDNKFLYKGNYVRHRFDSKSNNYETSEIKQFLNNWLKELQSGNKNTNIDDFNESLNRKSRKLTESYNDNAFNMVSDSVDSIIDEIREGGDLEDVIRDEIDSHMLIYDDDIVDLARYYDVIDYSKLSNDVYEPLFEDLYSRVKDKLES